MSTITTGRDGIQYIHTNVLVPTHLRDFARSEGLSMSQILREGLEKEMNTRGGRS